METFVNKHDTQLDAEVLEAYLESREQAKYNSDNAWDDIVSAWENEGGAL